MSTGARLCGSVARDGGNGTRQRQGAMRVNGAGGGSRADDVRGALYMLMAGACLVAGISIIKHLAADLPEPVIVLFRHALALVFFGPQLWRAGFAVLRTRRIGAHLLRSACGYAGFLAFVFAAARMPLADVMALGFTQPLWAALIARFAFGERLGPMRAGALLAGFAGAMLVLKPTFDLPWAAIAALANAVLTSVAMMTVKRLSATEPAERIALMFLLVGALCSVPAAVATWQMPVGMEWPLLLVIGALAWLGQIGLSRGYGLGRFSSMAAMDFARLPFALAIGWFVFAEAPDLPAVLGMALIGLASTVIVLWPPRPP
jgi:drug/metabolite transporter (DMT)-like permease